MSLNRLLQAKNHQLMLWQACGTEEEFQRTLKHLILLKGTWGCVFTEMFLKCKCFWIFLSNQPLFLSYTSFRCVYLCKVRVFLQRASASKGRSPPMLFTALRKVKMILSISENKFPSLCVLMCMWGVMAMRLWQAESVEYSLFASYTQEMLQMILYHVGLQVLKLNSICVWWILLHS